MKRQSGTLPEEDDNDGTFRARHYIAKCNINLAIAHDMSRDIGSTEVGKRASLVLQYQAFFGINS